jgi:hypothetical protein
MTRPSGATVPHSRRCAPRAAIEIERHRAVIVVAERRLVPAGKQANGTKVQSSDWGVQAVP